MDNIIEINTGEKAVGKNDVIIKTSGIGSCVFISIYDKINKIGGAIHAMLPTRKKYHKNDFLNISNKDDKGKYVDEGLMELVDEIVKMGGEKKNLVAKVVGGASMFKVFDNSKIGHDNVKTAEKILQLLSITVKNESTGGHIGRSARFNLANGMVEVTVKM